MNGAIAVKIVDAILAMGVEVRVGQLGKDAVALSVEADELCVYTEGPRAGQVLHAVGERACRVAAAVFGDQAAGRVVRSHA